MSRYLIAALLVGVLIRATYFVQLSGTPCMVHHQWAQTDMNFFDRWGKHLAAGDWLMADTPFHPLHGWHIQLGKKHLERTSPGSADDLGQVKKLWDHWYGETRFHQEPLYPYLIGLSYRFVSEDHHAIFLWQALLGLLSVLLIYRITRRRFGETTAAVAAWLATLLGLFPYYELLLLRSSLETFLMLLLLDRVDRAQEGPGPVPWLVAGVVGGLAVLTKVNLAPFVLALIAVTWVTQKGWRSVSAFTGGAALALLPAMIRNLITGAPFFSLESVGPVTFVASNAVDFDPRSGFFISSFIEPIFSLSDGRWFESIRGALATHPDVWSYLSLLSKKFILLWNGYEVPNNTNYYYYREQGTVLKWLLTYQHIAPLAFLGIILSRKKSRDLWSLYFLIAIQVATMLLFYVLSRFRFPMVTLLIPFAAYACVRISEWFKAKDLRALLASGAAVAFFVLVVRMPLVSDSERIRVVDYVAPLEYFYVRETEGPQSKAEWENRERRLALALRVEPPFMRELEAGRKTRTNDEVFLARAFANGRSAHAAALRAVGNEEQARVEESRARLIRASIALPGG